MYMRDVNSRPALQSLILALATKLSRLDLTLYFSIIHQAEKNNKVFKWYLKGFQTH